MEESSKQIKENLIIDYIKAKYPRIIFNPLNLGKENKKSLGFIFNDNDNHLIIGFVSANGNLCKLIEPIDITKITNENLIDILKKIPIAESFFDLNTRDSIINLLENKGQTISLIEHQQILDTLKKQIDSDKDTEYKVLLEDNVNSKNTELILIKKGYEDTIKEITDNFNKELQNLKDAQDLCKNKLLSEKEQIIEAIKIFKSDILNFIKTRDLMSQEQIKQLQSVHTQVNNEKSNIEESLNMLLNKEKEYLSTIENDHKKLFEANEIIKQQQDKLTSISEQLSQMSELSNKTNSENFNKISDGEAKQQQLMIEIQQNKSKLDENEILLKSKQDEINKLNNSITTIQNNLNDLQESFNKEQVEKIALQNFKSNCLIQILQEKETIMAKIKEYNQEWFTWVNKNNIDIEMTRNKLKDDLFKILDNLKDIIKHRNNYIDSLNIDSKSKDELLQQIKNNANDIKTAIQKTLADQFIELGSLKEQPLNETLEIKPNESVQNTIEKLNQVQTLLTQNNNTIIPKEIDYTNCLAISKKYKDISNSFVRKQQIIKYLDDIINSINPVFNNLPDSTKIILQNTFNSVKIEIQNYLTFLNFAEYSSSNYFQNIKEFHKNSLKQAPPDFCNKITDILDHWDSNIESFRKQDLILTNLYEDLSNVVKIYIQYNKGKGKISNVNKIISLELSCDKENRDSIKLTNLSGIFDDRYSNLFIYTGIVSSQIYLDKINKFKVNDFIEKSDTLSPGLFHSLKQLEDGYSIVVFENQNFFFGNYQTQEVGILHYLFNTLENVKNIKIKNIFEQTLNTFNPNPIKITSKLINLVNKLPSQFQTFSIDDLITNISSDNFTSNDIFNLSENLYKYRLNQNRIKKIFNKDSYRSNLFIIFEITFVNGNSGYLTICNLASLLTPENTVSQFLDVNENKLGQILSNGKCQELFKLNLPKIYTEEFIIDTLKESFYINETFNHLSYFLNKKSFKTNTLKKVDSFSTFDKDEFFVLPIDNSGNGEEILINKNNNCLTIPILKFLDTISNINTETFKPTKFLVLNKINCEDQDLVHFIQKIN
jgi:hypothetical protein